VKKHLTSVVRKVVGLPALRAGFGLCFLIIFSMSTIGWAAILLIPLRIIADIACAFKKGTDARVLLQETLSSIALLGLAAVLSILLDPSLHPAFSTIAGIAGLSFRITAEWAVCKALWHHPLWTATIPRTRLHPGIGLSLVSLTTLLLLMLSPLVGVQTKTVRAAVMHLTPSPW
jgi:hypothetical protein